MIDLRAEAAADIGRHDADLVLGQLEHEGAHQEADDVRVLARGVERVVAGGALELADRRARLHRIGDEPVVDDVELRHMRRLGESRFGRGLVADMPVVAEIAGRVVVDLRLRPASAPPRPRRRGGTASGNRSRSVPPRPWRWSRVSAMTMATGSPTWRTWPCASTGCGGSAIGEPSFDLTPQPQGRPSPTCRSAPV